MHVKALKTFIGREGSIRRGAVFETDPRRGRELERRGLVVPLLDAPETQAPATMLETFPPPPPGEPPAAQFTPGGEAGPGVLGTPTVPPTDGVAETGGANPTLFESALPPGGPTGADAAPSSSPRARRPRTSRSKKRATAAPDSLP